MVSLTSWIGNAGRLACGEHALRSRKSMPRVASDAIATAFSHHSWRGSGELVLKTLAPQRAEQVALAVAAPMEAFLTLIRPNPDACVVPDDRVPWSASHTREAPSTRPMNLKLTSARASSADSRVQVQMIHNAIEPHSIKSCRYGRPPHIFPAL
jgi:hypothetical protein